MSGRRYNKNPLNIPKVIPMQNAPQFDINDITEKNCIECGCQHFNPVVKLGIISGLSPKNPQGKDILIKIEVYLCLQCGTEYGEEKRNENP